MRLSERSYPHPVVGNRDDVPGAGFQAVIQATSDKEYFYIDVQVRCSSDAVASLVKSKKAAYVVHVECTNTMFRDAKLFHDDQCRIQIPSTKLFDRFEVNVFACALGTISSYSVPGAHDDYDGAQFDLSEGDIIALADGEDFFVEAEDSLVSVGSIMVVEESKSAEAGPMTVAYNRDKIAIILSKRDFAAYKLLKSHEHLGSTLTSTIVLPVLMQALTMMKSKAEDAEFTGLRWYDNLTRRIDKLGLSGKDFDVLDVAQLLLDQPIRRALSAGKALAEAGA